MDTARLVDRFDAERPRLLGIAYRILGSASDADDAVQETWLRLSRANSEEIENMGGWLTTVVGRVCLDMLRKRRSQREDTSLDAEEPLSGEPGPEREAELSESVGTAMIAVLHHLSPAERVAFVLHDVFGVAFEEISPIVGRSLVATRKLASRGRQRIRGSINQKVERDKAVQEYVIDAFLRASREGDFQALLAVLDPDVALRADTTALNMGVRSGWLPSELRGAEAVARQFQGRADAAQLALLDGTPGAVWATRGTPRVAFEFSVQNGKITEIHLAADPDRLNTLSVALLQ